MTQKVKDRDAFGVTFANPASPSNTTRVRQETKNKTLQGVVLPNNVVEMVGLRSVEVPGHPGVMETLSVRIKISGSSLNQSATIDLAKDVMGISQTWLGEDVLVGFDPQTPPTY